MLFNSTKGSKTPLDQQLYFKNLFSTAFEPLNAAGVADACGEDKRRQSAARDSLVLPGCFTALKSEYLQPVVFLPQGLLY
jgi:hypothetical protein